ncbi:MarR family winged helix-turn-helix transcriptional regulator [Streptomyces sp. NPDC048516]|uniref:MarR family winged helix-turn-helix transcriptional regulator n=1 Tax=Streptomyces sp. NPDC048516 TaxID=3365565 RepID=UPI00371672D0
MGRDVTDSRLPPSAGEGARDEDDPGEAARDEGGLAEETAEVTAAVMAASRLVVALSARALAEASSALTLPQLRALVVLDGCGPVKLVELATTLGVNPSTALRMVERLEAAGLVDRKVNPDNRREVVLRLTGPGGELVRTVLDHRHREIAALVGRLPGHVRSGLVVGLRALVAIADDPAIGPSPAAGARDMLTGGSGI